MEGASHRADRRSFLRTAVAGGIGATSFAAAPAGAAGWTPAELRQQLSQVAPTGVEDATGLRRHIASLPPRGGVLRLQPGGYALGATVVIDRPLLIIAEGAGVTVSATVPPFAIESDHVAFEGITFLAEDAPMQFFDERPGDNHEGLRVSGCRFTGFSLNISSRNRDVGEGDTEARGTGVVRGVQVVGCELSEYEDSYTLEIAGVNDAVVERCWIHDTGRDREEGDGIKVLHGSVGTRIAFCTIENTTRDGIDIYNAHESTLIGNVIRGCGSQGIDAKWGANDQIPLGRDLIADNRIYDVVESAYAIDVNDALVTGNFAHGAQEYGFTASTSNDDSLTPTERVQFVGNHALGCREAGFNFSAGIGFVLVGNVVEGTSNYGIGLGPETSGFTIIGNRSVNNDGEAISIDEAASGRHFLAGNTTDGGFDNDLVMSGRLAHSGERVGFFGASPVERPPDPGEASGPDAEVINNVVEALRNLGLIS
jgi:parallel beta-helix repeat protein